jgi:hypothetical protein
MSRTYRRKNEEWDNWELYDYTFIGGIFTKVAYEVGSIAYKKGVALYHSDKFMTMGQVPKWYKVYFCRKPFRRKEKEAVYKAVKYSEEDIVFPKPVKDALYYW